MATDLLVYSLQVFESLPERQSEVYACPPVDTPMRNSVLRAERLFMKISVKGQCVLPCPKQCILIFKVRAKCIKFYRDFYEVDLQP